MFKSPLQRGWQQSLLRALSLSIIASLLLASVLQAGDPDQKSPNLPQVGAEVAQPNAVTADDGGAWELGVHGTAGNLTTATAAERYGMWYWLSGWFALRYSFNEATAWERDFKRPALGGTENSYIDSVDLQFYVGHGAPGLFTFDNANYNDSTLSSPNDCNTTWGDGDNEWLALTSCQVLADSGLGGMAQCMNHQHLILGFVSNASAHNEYYNTQAYHFGRYLRYGYNMTQAWFNACDIAQRGRVARVMAEETACFSDNPYYGSVCADVLDSDYYWYTHNCGTPMSTYVPVAQIEAVPVFRTKAYGLAEAQQDLTHLGGVFSIPVTATLQAGAVGEDPAPPGAPVNDSFYVSTNVSKTLQMDKGSGMFQYSDLSQLWTPQQAEQALALRAASVNYPSNDVVKRAADAFLAQNGLMPGDAVFSEVVSDTVANIDKGTVTSAAVVQAAETPALVQAIYTRQLTATAVMAAGVHAPLNFMVAGGPKIKVYYPATAGVTAAGLLDTPPIGAQGDWRDVEVQINAASGEQVMTDILDVETAKQLYLALDKEVTMNSIPLDIKSRTILSETLVYYEFQPGVSQGELIPAFAFLVEFVEKNTNAVSQDTVYVPAAPKYMRPIARIVDAPTTGKDIGSAITLTAADATKTLQALSAGNFDFVMGFAGAAGTYTYDWYLGSVAPENKITDLNTSDGAGKVTFNLPNAIGDHDRILDVYLVVGDKDSPNKSESIANAKITVNPAIFVPLMTKQ